MNTPNILLAVDLMVKIAARIQVANSLGRDISDEEIIDLNRQNIKKANSLADLIKQRIEEEED